jgi:hypothetical protein
MWTASVHTSDSCCLHVSAEENLPTVGELQLQPQVRSSQCYCARICLNATIDYNQAASDSFWCIDGGKATAPRLLCSVHTAAATFRQLPYTSARSCRTRIVVVAERCCLTKGLPHNCCESDLLNLLCCAPDFTCSTFEFWLHPDR